MRKPKFKSNVVDARSGKPHHFYASSIARWETGEDVGALIDKMKHDPYPFLVMLVPLPLAAPYRIENFTPQVEGCVWLAHYEVAQ